MVELDLINNLKIKKKLSKKIKNSPTFQIFTSINHLSKISGRILDFYDDDFLVGDIYITAQKK